MSYKQVWKKKDLRKGLDDMTCGKACQTAWLTNSKKEIMYLRDKQTEMQNNIGNHFYTPLFVALQKASAWQCSFEKQMHCNPILKH